MKEISIIIATYNASKTLLKCLDSIVPQLTDECELVIVDVDLKITLTISLENIVINCPSTLVNRIMEFMMHGIKV